MSVSNATDFDAEYSFTDGKTILSAKEFNRRFLSIHQRLNGVELKGEGYDSLISEGTAAALKRINDGVAPLLANLFEQIELAETTLDLLETQVAAGITADKIRLAAIVGIAANNVQAAVSELKSKIDASLTKAASDAAQISVRSLYFSNF